MPARLPGRTVRRALLVAALLAPGTVLATAAPAAAYDPVTFLLTPGCRWLERGASTPVDLLLVNQSDAPVRVVDVAPLGALPPGVTAGAVTGVGATVQPNGYQHFRTDVAVAADAPAGPVQLAFRLTTADGAFLDAPWPTDVVGAPDPPVTVTAVAGDTTAYVSWSRAAANSLLGRSTQRFEVTASPGGATTAVLYDTFATVGGLTNGTAYTFTVRAWERFGWSAPSQPSAPVTPAGVPRRVTGAAVAGGGTSRVVSWDEADGNGSPVTGYTVTTYPGGTTTAAGPGDRTVEVTGLDESTEYGFTVRAANALGDGPESRSTADPAPAGVPRAFDGTVTVTPRDGTFWLDVSWSSPDPVATGYDVVVQPGGALIHLSGAPTAGLAGWPLTNGTTYTVTVAATGPGGAGPAGPASDPFVPAGPPFGDSVAPLAAGLDGAAYVCWLGTYGDGSPVTGYVVTDRWSGRSWTLPPGNSAVLPGLTNGVPYQLTIHTISALGSSTESNWSPESTVMPGGAPHAATGVAATAGDGVATVTWDAADGNGSGLTSYDVVASPGGATVHVPSTVTEAEVPGLTNGTAYTFTVRAWNAWGDAGSSAPSDAVTPEPPPPSVAALPAFTIAARVGVTWQPGGATAYDVRYRVARRDASFNPFHYASGLAATSFDLAAARGYTYCFAVRAREAAGGVSGWSPERCTAVALDDRAMTASAGWARGASTAYYAGTYTAATKAGATLSLDVRARRVAIVATRCPGCGTLGLFVDGVLVRNVSLDAATTSYRQVLGVDLGTVRTGTLTLRSLTSTRTYVDGLGVSAV